MSELRSGEALRTMSPNLHVNCLFKHTVGDAEVCIVVEVQVHISAILETKREAHKVRETKCARDCQILCYLGVRETTVLFPCG